MEFQGDECPQSTSNRHHVRAAQSCDILSWRRLGQWSFYPEDHIGRLVGTAHAFLGHPPSGLLGPGTLPTWPWSEDEDAYGSNDFRSTKLNILEATLADSSGLGLHAVAAADRHVHAWMDGDQALMMIATSANDGSQRISQVTRAIPDQPIAVGGAIAGTAQVEITLPP